MNQLISEIQTGANAPKVQVEGVVKAPVDYNPMDKARLDYNQSQLLTDTTTSLVNNINRTVQSNEKARVESLLRAEQLKLDQYLAQNPQLLQATDQESLDILQGKLTETQDAMDGIVNQSTLYDFDKSQFWNSNDLNIKSQENGYIRYREMFKFQSEKEALQENMTSSQNTATKLAGINLDIENNKDLKEVISRDIDFGNDAITDFGITPQNIELQRIGTIDSMMKNNGAIATDAIKTKINKGIGYKGELYKELEDVFGEKYNYDRATGEIKYNPAYEKQVDKLLEAYGINSDLRNQYKKQMLETNGREMFKNVEGLKGDIAKSTVLAESKEVESRKLKAERDSYTNKIVSLFYRI